MATKWKSSTVFILYALLLAVGSSGPLLLTNQGDRYLYRDYYQTPEFREQLDLFASYLNVFQLNSLSLQEAKDSLTVKDYEIANYRDQSGSLSEQLRMINEEYAPLIEEAKTVDNVNLTDDFTAKRDGKLEETMKLFKDDEYVASLVRKEKEQRLESYYNYRETRRDEYNLYQDQFYYFFRSPSTGAVHSVIGDETNDNGHVYKTNYTIDIGNSLHYMFGAQELLEESIVPYQGWISVPKDSPMREAATRYRREQWILYTYGIACTVLLVAGLTRFNRVITLQANRGRWSGSLKKLPIDARLLLFAGTAALTFGMLTRMVGKYPYLFDAPVLYGWKLLLALVFATLGMALAVLQGQLLAGGLRNGDDFRNEWSHSLSRRINRRLKVGYVQVTGQVKDSFLYKSTGTRLLALALLWIGLGFAAGWALFTTYYDNDLSYFIFTPIWAMVAIAAFYFSTRQIGYLNRIVHAADELASGRMPNELPHSGNGVLASLASNINVLRRGVTTLQNEQAKSERLKTELITNVSHDLRTPLTSIITYAGLLQAENVTVEERAAYVEIINQKSKRLKTMIDDLFEVSTMASGNAKLLPEKTDLVQLMQQALAEYKEMMDGSDVQFRISMPEGPIYVIADGQKLWRAFDNLIGNMIKYALDHTRAYISMQLSERHEVAIQFKNVSKYEIADNAEELFERFKRGDLSRHTEGSGLGLAIAQSIVELHDGSLTLETDGDLFKATVILKLHEPPTGG